MLGLFLLPDIPSDGTVIRLSDLSGYMSNCRVALYSKNPDTIDGGSNEYFNAHFTNVSLIYIAADHNWVTFQK